MDNKKTTAEQCTFVFENPANFNCASCAIKCVISETPGFQFCGEKSLSD